jgi:hypothetical protein
VVVILWPLPIMAFAILGMSICVGMYYFELWKNEKNRIRHPTADLITVGRLHPGRASSASEIVTPGSVEARSHALWILRRRR